MKLYKDGITFELYHPRDIAKYKQMGFVEVKDPEPVKPADPVKSPKPSPKAGKPKESVGAKDGDQ